ncbi:hypothetical protein EST38_g2392 [Candolleomyces aberdarensis]|uniref:Cation efflux protein n=1 Tax=Candolleomyces aberdarensis TaxID=2316362 RepID=A0A4Q2DWZ3_9AGAR|nr:hypothetical protein EST38_g2392 [Candolleomyces aberdarensis]
MALSRSTRITLLLIIDVIFFFVELIVGYAVGSLALVADSFHMLNDVLSLVVALYAIKMTNASEIDSRYSYGWHRAEILAALVNGVFLLALCFSIFLEAIERFFATPEISNPKLVVVVGSLGLASNIVGLFLFHEHGHSHHHHTPAGSKAPSVAASREGSIHEGAPKNAAHAHSHSHSHPQPIRGRSNSRDSSGSEDDGLYGHPAATRASLVQTAHEIAARSPSPTAHRRSLSMRASLDSGSTVVRDPRAAEGHHAHHPPARETTPLLGEDSEEAGAKSSPPHDHDHEHDAHEPLLPHDHSHSHKHGHGHSHGSMNMRALVLHVIGDALGNVGVILTGLIIWKSTWAYKYYCDPIISLIITVIIFSSALPLVKSASFILLQGVPPTVSIDEVKDAILAVDGVLSLHELHVWQLSENKLVASVHVLASRSHDFMPIAAKIRKALHHLGIHSSTIQPEYPHPPNYSPGESSQKSSADSCLILCPADQNCDPSENACCPPPPVEV